MKRKTHRTETHIETHEIKIIRFGTQRVNADRNATETLAALVQENASAHGSNEGEDHETSNKEN